MEFPVGQQFRRGHRCPQVHQPRLVQRANHFHHQPGHIELLRTIRRAENVRLRRRCPTGYPHVKAGLGTGLNQPAAFQDLVGLQHGGDTDRFLPNQLSHRRDTVPGAQRTLLDQVGNLLRNLFVKTPGLN